MNMTIPWMSLFGGALIGLSASMLLALHGRVAGISGIIGGLLQPKPGEVAWRALFVLGLLLGGSVMYLGAPTLFGVTTMPPAVIAGAGLLVGFGTRLGGGCTSGHGVCGVSRLSKRSIVATATFMVGGAVSTYLMLHVLRFPGATP